MTPPETPAANGPVVAAIFSAAAGCFIVALLNVAAAMSQSLTKIFSFYVPSGALSGESTIAIFLWLAMWALLAKRWGGRTLPQRNILLAAYILLFVGLVMTFPPVVHLLATI